MANGLRNEKTETLGISLDEVNLAQMNLKGVAKNTPFDFNENLSRQFEANVYLKREDLQVVRSYKLRGAYNKIVQLSEQEKNNGVICASAGNHAQGVAYSCQQLNIKGKIVMPTTTPQQKIKQVKWFGKDQIEIILHGDTFDDASAFAHQLSQEGNITFIHPFDDEKVIAGQGTVALEILNQCNQPIDYIFVPIGGGGLASGVISVMKTLSPNTKIIGVEPSGAASMAEAIKQKQSVALAKIDPFVDGAAVKKAGEKTYKICAEGLETTCAVPEGKVCSSILRLYNEDAIVVEPAGALSVSALDFFKEEIKGKNVVCVLSGSNNDITRMEEIKERSLQYEGLKHYFIINFPQRAGALKELVNEVLGENDDITYFQYTQKNNKETGPAVVGIELDKKEDLDGLIFRLENHHFDYQYLNTDNTLFSLMIG
ncbi:threonine ammonia-lyase IlvA [Empedobacter falsenii]|uniref:L-threonine dehydratase n=1 Tax=Empedobacter falsenii TaxID=343874 RepID=A0A376J304_9FLAO|nr:threonine ammonia-lyase IlvA [Empedobacter falsenii]STE54860.1 L-threonine dehydratase biosynthetic IlvA [Empedobacter falsenii]